MELHARFLKMTRTISNASLDQTLALPLRQASMWGNMASAEGLSIRLNGSIFKAWSPQISIKRYSQWTLKHLLTTKMGRTATFIPPFLRLPPLQITDSTWLATIHARSISTMLAKILLAKLWFSSKTLGPLTVITSMSLADKPLHGKVWQQESITISRHVTSKALV